MDESLRSMISGLPEKQYRDAIFEMWSNNNSRIEANLFFIRTLISVLSEKDNELVEALQETLLELKGLEGISDEAYEHVVSDLAVCRPLGESDA